MHSDLFHSIQLFGRFTEADKALLVDKFTVKNYLKNEILLQEGHICRSIYFINEGAFRQFYISNEGEDVSLNFFIKNDWVLDPDSFMGQKPSLNTLIAVEDCTVLELSIQNLHGLIAQSQVFLQLGKVLNTSKRDAFYDTLISPEEKYKHLLASKPQYLQQFPLKQVASFLKITPETLSRVRRKIIQA